MLASLRLAQANVDPETDELIQQAMRTQFTDCTLLCIAHRLQTVIDYDQIAVLEQGELLEFDPPLALLRNECSHFYSMCESTGDIAGMIALAQSARAVA